MTDGRTKPEPFQPCLVCRKPVASYLDRCPHCATPLEPLYAKRQHEELLVGTYDPDLEIVLSTASPPWIGVVPPGRYAFAQRDARPLEIPSDLPPRITFKGGGIQVTGGGMLLKFRRRPRFLGLVSDRQVVAKARRTSEGSYTLTAGDSGYLLHLDDTPTTAPPSQRSGLIARAEGDRPAVTRSVRSGRIVDHNHDQIARLAFRLYEEIKVVFTPDPDHPGLIRRYGTETRTVTIELSGRIDIAREVNSHALVLGVAVAMGSWARHPPATGVETTVRTIEPYDGPDYA